MANQILELTGPDGTVYEMEVPKGASMDQIAQKARAFKDRIVQSRAPSIQTDPLSASQGRWTQMLDVGEVEPAVAPEAALQGAIFGGMTAGPPGAVAGAAAWGLMGPAEEAGGALAEKAGVSSPQSLFAIKQAASVAPLLLEGGLATLLSKPISAVRGATSVENALNMLAGKMRRRAEDVAQEVQTVGGLQARLRMEGIQGADVQPMDIMTREESERIFGAGQYPQKPTQPPFETPNDLFRFSEPAKQPAAGRPRHPLEFLPDEYRGWVGETPEDLLSAEERRPPGLKRQAPAPEPPSTAPKAPERRVEPLAPTSAKAPVPLLETPTGLRSVGADMQKAREIVEDIDRQARESVSKSKTAAAEAVASGGGDGPDIPRYGDSAPEHVLSDESTDAFVDESTRMGPLARTGLPINAIPHSRWRLFLTAVRDTKRQLGKLSLRLEKEVGKIKTAYSINGPEDEKELIRAVEGLRMQPDGSLLQTEQDVSERMEKAARAYRHKITDKLWEVVTGLKPQAVAIARELGLGETERTWKLLRAIQENPDQFLPKSQAAELVAAGVDISGQKVVPDAVWEGARRTKGMLNFGATHDLRPIYEQGYFTHMPIPQERAVLEQQRDNLQKMIELGGNPDDVARMQQALGMIDKRLGTLEGRLQESLQRGAPMTELHPRRKFDANWNITRDPEAAEFGWDMSLDRVSQRMIRNATAKRALDATLGMARDFMPVVENDPRAKKYVNDWLAHQRGVRGFGEDAWITDLVNSVKGWAGRDDVMTHGQVRRNLARILRFVATTRLNLSMRFPLINSLQPLQTVLAFVEPSVYGRAEMRGIGAVNYLIAQRYLGDAAARALTGDGRKYYTRALTNGVFNETEQFLEEAGHAGGLFEKVTDVVGVPAQITELRNRVVANEAFREQALRPDFTPHPYIMRFMGETTAKPGTVRFANAYARAGVDATQFVFGTEGKPLAYAGGTVRSVATQFKSFQSGLAALFKGLYDEKDWVGLTKALSALYFLGGPLALSSVVPGGAPLYLGVRKALSEMGGPLLPIKPGIGYLPEILGHGFVSPLDVTSSLDVISMPTGLRDFAGAAGSALLDMGVAALKLQSPIDESGRLRSPLTPEAARLVVRAIAPSMLAFGEGVKELQTGAVSTPEGRPLATRRPIDALARTLNLRVSTRGELAQYKNDIRSAVRGGRMDIASGLIEEATERGLRLPPSIVAATLQAKRRKGMKEAGESLYDMFSPPP